MLIFKKISFSLASLTKFRGGTWTKQLNVSRTILTAHQTTVIGAEAGEPIRLF